MAGSVNKHGHAGKIRSPTYLSWRAMCARKNKKNSIYSNIFIDKKWLIFVNFLKDMGDRPEGKTLDRIDNKKGYSRENCRWSTYLDQTRNRKNTVKVVYKGEEWLLMDLTKKLKANHRRTWERMKYLGWSIEEALGKEKYVKQS